MAGFESPSQVRPSFETDSGGLGPSSPESVSTRAGSWWYFFLADPGGPRSMDMLLEPNPSYYECAYEARSFTFSPFFKGPLYEKLRFI